MKAAARMRHFPPSEPRTTCLVTTNRCQYAQLAQQPFAPPRGYRLPPPNHPGLWGRDALLSGRGASSDCPTAEGTKCMVREGRPKYCSVTLSLPLLF